MLRIILGLLILSLAATSESELQTDRLQFCRSRCINKLAPNVYQAVGFGLANVLIVLTKNGCVIVDTMEGERAATEVKAAIKKHLGDAIDNVHGIFLTHSHPDHCGGGGVFANKDTTIIAHKDFDTSRIVTMHDAAYTRSARIYGTYLPEDEKSYCGIGPELNLYSDDTLAKRLPTELAEDGASYTIDGEHFVVFHAPGETADQMMIWYPKHRVLFAGDDIYHAFPNLYTIRGAPPRSAIDWVYSIDHMRSLKPDVIGTSHDIAVSPADEVMAALTAYRDGIQYVHDQTVRLANKGMFLDDIVHEIKLPETLATNRFLQQTYGTVEWSVRGIFEYYLGWFGGDPAKLNPLRPVKQAKLMADLVGGTANLKRKAMQYAEIGEHQFALELADAALKALGGHKKDKQLIQTRVECLRALADTQTSPNGRHYYLTMAHEAEGNIEIPPAYHIATAEAMLLEPRDLFEGMAARLKAEKVLDDPVRSAAWQFVDRDNVTVVLTIRNGVAQVEVHDDAPVNKKLYTKALVRWDTWVRVSTKDVGIMRAILSKDEYFTTEEGGAKGMAKFFLFVSDFEPIQ